MTACLHVSPIDAGQHKARRTTREEWKGTRPQGPEKTPSGSEHRPHRYNPVPVSWQGIQGLKSCPHHQLAVRPRANGLTSLGFCIHICEIEASGACGKGQERPTHSWLSRENAPGPQVTALCSTPRPPDSLGAGAAWHSHGSRKWVSCWTLVPPRLPGGQDWGHGPLREELGNSLPASALQ